jgi:hypothetical protein
MLPSNSRKAAPNAAALSRLSQSDDDQIRIAHPYSAFFRGALSTEITLKSKP